MHDGSSFSDDGKRQDGMSSTYLSKTYIFLDDLCFSYSAVVRLRYSDEKKM